MSASPFRPNPFAAASVPPRALSADEQAELDRLYWDESDSQLTVASIAALFALPAGGLCRIVTPLSSERTCLLCGAPGVRTSRSQLKSGALTCGGCGAVVQTRSSGYGGFGYNGQPRIVADEVLAAEVEPDPVDHVMVRRALGYRMRDLGSDAHQAVTALERAGRPFAAGRTVLILEPHDGIEEIRNLLSGFAVTTLAVESLRTLGDSQIEAMQNLLHLTSDGWRVVSALDTRAWKPDEDHDWFDDETYEDVWPVPDGGEAAWDRRGIQSGGLIIDATNRFGERW